MDIINFLVLASLTLNLILLLITYYRASSSSANFAFQWTLIAIAGWCLSMFIFRLANDGQADFWARVLYFFPPFIPVGFLLFALYFQQKKVTPFLVVIPILSAFVLGGISLFTNTIISGVITPPQGEHLIIFGNLYMIYLAYIPAYFLACFFIFLKKMQSVPTIPRAQISFILLGLMLATFPAMVTNLILPTLGIFTYNWLGQVFTSLWVASVTYAIIKHNFIDVKLIVLRAVVYILLLAGVAFAFTASVLWLSRSLFNTTLTRDQVLFYAAITLLAALTFQPIKLLLEHLSEKIFFKAHYDPQILLSVLSKKTTSTLLLDELTKSVLHQLLEMAQITRGAFYIHGDQNIQLTSAEGYDKQVAFDGEIIEAFDPKAIEVLESYKRVLYAPDEEDTLRIQLNRLQIVFFAPLYVGSICHGALILGEKKSGERYREQELNILTIFSSQFAVEVQNALSFEEIKRFNITLKDEVTKATTSLRSANEKLKEVDKMKDEFVSLASHELRTPMTAIKSYLWMALDGRGGPLTEKQKYYLGRAFKSTDKLIQLVNDMLNVSRIESGRISIHMQEVDLYQLTKDVLEEVSPRAQELQIHLTLIPFPNLPHVMADPDRIKEVLFNLVGNSLKFTPMGGSITISFGDIDQVEVRIKDTGAGIATEDMSKLFQKFGFLSGSYTVNKTATQGTGLGLYICRSIVEIHGGRINATSDGIGKGALFSFTLKRFNQEEYNFYMKIHPTSSNGVGLVHNSV